MTQVSRANNMGFSGLEDGFFVLFNILTMTDHLEKIQKSLRGEI